MKTLKNHSQLLLYLPLCLVSLHAQATRYAAAGGNYNISLVANYSALATTPTVGSNNHAYYLIAPPNSTGITVDETTSNPTGLVTCQANYLEGNYRQALDSSYAYHRLFAYFPEAGFTLNGLAAYKINSNTFYTLYTRHGMTSRWVNISAPACSNTTGSQTQTSYFSVQFPFEVRVYIKEIPIDGKVVIPNSTLAGYVRVFDDKNRPDFYVPVDKATVTLNLATSVINYPSSCRSSIDNLNIDHKTLDAFDFNSKETRTITYTCERAQPIKVKLTLDYVADSDPEKRVPLKSGNNTIYSDVTLFDEQTNQRGKTIETTINKVKNIRIESQLSGSGAEPGDYKGNAWLIATFI